MILDDNGDVCEIFDKELGKNILKRPIRMGLHEYYGSVIYPAWELRYQSVCKEPITYAAEPEFEILEKGPARVTIRTSRTAGESLFYQTISLTATGAEVLTRYRNMEAVCRQAIAADMQALRNLIRRNQRQK